MKTFLLYATIGLATIVGQTTILRLSLFQGIFYDLLIPMVVFVRLNLPVRTAAILVLIIGFVMDLFSGSQFGLYLSVYFWIFIVVKGVSNYFDVQGSMFRSMLIALGVLAEHLIFFVFSVVPGNGVSLLACRIAPVMWQTIFAAITGPAIVMGLEKIQPRAETMALDGEKYRQNLTVR